MKRKVGAQSIEDILAAHADSLNRGRHEAARILPDEVGNAESLRSLLAVAELLQEALTPVQPSPAFVRRLGKSLLASTRERRKAMTFRMRRAALVGAAALGSLLSLASVIGLVVYMLRHRVRA